MASIPMEVGRADCNIFLYCAQYESEGKTLTKLLEKWEEHFAKEEMAKWLSHVDNYGSNFFHVCDRYQSEGETLLKLLEYGEKCLSDEEMATWLSHVKGEG